MPDYKLYVHHPVKLPLIDDVLHYCPGKKPEHTTHPAHVVHAGEAQVSDPSIKGNLYRIRIILP